MRDPKKKCIAKKCEECNFYQDWDVEKQKDGKPTGIRKLIQQCSLQVLSDEIPHIRGSIDGCQKASNQTYNKVDAYGQASIATLESIDRNIPKLLR